MAASKQDIRKWLTAAADQHAAFMLVITDTFDWEDYPLVVQRAEDLKLTLASSGQNMQRVTEVYDLSLPIEPQLNEFRAWHTGEETA